MTLSEQVSEGAKSAEYRAFEVFIMGSWNQCEVVCVCGVWCEGVCGVRVCVV